MNYYNNFTSHCIHSKTPDSLKFHTFVKMYFYCTHPPPSPRVLLSLWKSVQIASSYRQHHMEAYIQLNVFKSYVAFLFYHVFSLSNTKYMCIKQT